MGHPVSLYFNPKILKLFANIVSFDCVYAAKISELNKRVNLKSRGFDSGRTDVRQDNHFIVTDQF